MDLRGWDQRYRTRERLSQDFEAEATPLLIQTVKQLRPGAALDLACGTGRNAIWLAKQGWQVAAVDGSPVAIEALREQAGRSGLNIEAQSADLQKNEFQIEPARWDLIAVCYYLQRDLIENAKQGLREGGLLLVIVHIVEPGAEPTPTRMKLGELRTYFKDWDILHDYEGASRDAAHQRPVAEIVARRPLGWRAAGAVAQVNKTVPGVNIGRPQTI